MKNTLVDLCYAALFASLLFVLLILLTKEDARAEVKVYKDEFSLYAHGDFCGYRLGALGCGEVLKQGVHKYVTSADGMTLVPSKLMATTNTTRTLVPFEFGADFNLCNSVADGVSTTCSPNIFFKVKELNDPEIRQQWHLPFIEAPRAWDIKETPENCVVAVIDTGVDCQHPDLKDQCVPGYNAITNQKNWAGSDVNGHGTHVAGIVAATWNNARGGVGVSQCKILPVKVLGDSGGGSLYNVMKGVEYVRQDGRANIINMSLGSSGFSSSFLSAVTAAIQSGVTVVAAAGNDGTNNDRYPHYPSNFKSVVSVGALDVRGDRARFSNYGTSVDVWAPGVNIYSTYPGNSGRNLSGTSMASPVVAGAFGFSGALYAEKQLNMYCLSGGDCDTAAPAPKPSPDPAPVCKEKKLKRCYKGRCYRYRVYRRRAAWKACRKNCQRVWCGRPLTRAEDSEEVW